MTTTVAMTTTVLDSTTTVATITLVPTTTTAVPTTSTSPSPTIVLPNPPTLGPINLRLFTIVEAQIVVGWEVRPNTHTYICTFHSFQLRLLGLMTMMDSISISVPSHLPRLV